MCIITAHAVFHIVTHRAETAFTETTSVKTP